MSLNIFFKLLISLSVIKYSNIVVFLNDPAIHVSKMAEMQRHCHDSFHKTFIPNPLNVNFRNKSFKLLFLFKAKCIKISKASVELSSRLHALRNQRTPYLFM